VVVLVFQESNQPYPTVHFSGGVSILTATSYKVTADSCDIIPSTDGDVVATCSTMMAAYWSYGYKYHKGVKRTLTFLDHFVLFLDDSKTVPLPVLRLKMELSKST
jgi:hypothetical protein